MVNGHRSPITNQSAGQRTVEKVSKETPTNEPGRIFFAIPTAGTILLARSKGMNSFFLSLQNKTSHVARIGGGAVPLVAATKLTTSRASLLVQKSVRFQRLFIKQRYGRTEEMLIENNPF